MASPSRLRACARAESTASGRFFAAVLASVITGRLSGPATSGYVRRAVQPRTPQSKGPAAHLAVALSWQTTSSSTGSAYFAWR
ncbi:hypothetical protein QQM39_16845 [Streptomyces sp. DT2A-34]|uniref:hypothetical protein n=1 Tax=Streptomyces sp. DT2A-34 TaxID=3051182 RepID=UPI00265C2B64|nr:hypothetical protein [Streptomyces sp. DT2A-34]MDO0912457.1 hypothetical protein [Streptomyces sp. DT2A-34]